VKTDWGRGDDGTTSLLGGERRRKDDARVEAYGAVDELDAQIGVAAAAVPDSAAAERLGIVQDDLHHLAAALAKPEDPPAALVEALERAADRVESWTREIDAALPPLREFVRPGGVPAAAALHVARTVCRRAERRVATVAAVEPVPPAALRYLNRLSDFLFWLARQVNRKAGIPDCPAS